MHKSINRKNILLIIIFFVIVVISVLSVKVIPLLFDKETNIIVATLDSNKVLKCDDTFVSNHDFLRTDYSLDENKIKEISLNPKNYRVVNYVFNIKNISKKRNITDVEISPVFSKENKNIVIGMSKYLREGYVEFYPNSNMVLEKNIIVKSNDSDEELIRKFSDTSFVVKGNSWISLLGNEINELKVSDEVK